jgi:Phosphotransferase enzyme family
VPAPLDETIAHEGASVLGEPVVAIDPLAHSERTTATRSVARVHGATRSAIVKVVATEFAGHTEPSDPYFAPREPLLYEHGLPGAYTGASIRMPALLGRFQREHAVALWLEDASGTTAGALTPRNYELVARRLGRAHGSATTATNAVPWSTNFLPTYLSIWDDVGWERIDDDAAWEQPLIREYYAPHREALVALCRDRHEILAWADALPPTICHHDVWINNVFDNENDTVLIDWAFAGIGAIGCDPGNLVTDSCGDLMLATSLLPELDAAATTGYRAGLADAGWKGEFAEARLGMCLMAAKWSWLTPHMLRLAANDTHNVYGRSEVDAHHLFAERAAMLVFFTTLATEARALAQQLGLSNS